MVFEKIKELIVDTLGLDADSIKEESSLKEDLAVDSLDAMEVVFAIEEEYGISIAPEKLADFTTIHDIVKYVEENAN